MPISMKRIDPAALNLKEQVVAINRVTKVVKGGKNLSFSALVVIGDPSAKVVGYGVGKAKEVPSAIRKGIEAAKKALRHVNVLETTIAHQVLGQFSSSQVLLKPAPAAPCSRPAASPTSLPSPSAAAIRTTWSRPLSWPSNPCATAKPWPICAAWQWRNSNGRHHQNQTRPQPHLHSRQTQTGGQGAGPAETQSDRGAAGFSGLPRHGEESSASAGGRGVRSQVL